MKNFSITIKEKISGKILVETKELSNTKAYLEKKFQAKFRFNPVPVVIKIKQLRGVPGKQLDLIEAIKKAENGNS